ncbi:MAG: DUF1579 domain-containing protein [Planctomycetota bacterium]|jgi:hypothetical protein
MKLRLFAAGCVVGAGSALIGTQVLSQDYEQMGSPEEMAKMMDEYMKSLQPGKPHRMLDSSIGKWDTVTKMWWGGPGAPPVETNGTAEREWVLDGRFVLDKHESEMMMPDASGNMKPIPWEGMGLTGFDNNRNVYIGTWADSISTHLLTMKGTASPDGRTFTMYGEMDEPMLGMYGRIVKYVTRVISDDKQVFEIYDLAAGDDYKVVEVTYTRSQ